MAGDKKIDFSDTEVRQVLSDNQTSVEIATSPAITRVHQHDDPVT